MNKHLKTNNLKDPSAYFRPSVATDGVVFKIIDNELHVLLIKRKLFETRTTKEARPYQNYWALPGGFINKNENLDDCAERVIKEKTGLSIGFYGFSDIFSEGL